MNDKPTPKHQGPICVECGAWASRGSMKHPYCERHFIEKFGGLGSVAYDRYMAWLARTHG